MDIFKFHTPSGEGEDTHLIGGGEYINGIQSKEWIDRYRDAGSVTLKSRADKGIRELLPEGTLIGMRGSTSVMMIEDHQLSDDDNAIMVTTGRSLEAFLENRIVRYGVDSEGQFKFTANPPWPTWVQAASLIARQVTLVETGNDRIKHLEVVQDVQMDPNDATREGRSVARGELYAAVKSILDIDNIGWRIVRPGLWSPAEDKVNNIALVLHSGVDRRTQINMSYESGDIESADYLWSIQKYRATAVVYGKWITISVGDSLGRGLNRRVLYIDGKDIDEQQPAPNAPNAKYPMCTRVWRDIIDEDWDFTSGDPGEAGVWKEGTNVKGYSMSVADPIYSTKACAEAADEGPVRIDQPKGNHKWVWSHMDHAWRKASTIMGYAAKEDTDIWSTRSAALNPPADAYGWSDEVKLWINTAMRSRGKEALAARRRISLASVTPAKNAKTYIYGKDYDIGDIVTVRGNYSESRPMRVMEYVFIEDENGEFGYPTLEVLEDNQGMT
jgi:hypothetical protein